MFEFSAPATKAQIFTFFKTAPVLSRFLIQVARWRFHFLKPPSAEQRFQFLEVKRPPRNFVTAACNDNGHYPTEKNRPGCAVTGNGYPTAMAVGQTQRLCSGSGFSVRTFTWYSIISVLLKFLVGKKGLTCILYSKPLAHCTACTYIYTYCTAHTAH
jgi:hypothetical protein